MNHRIPQSLCSTCFRYHILFVSLFVSLLLELFPFYLHSIVQFSPGNFQTGVDDSVEALPVPLTNDLNYLFQKVCSVHHYPQLEETGSCVRLPGRASHLRHCAFQNNSSHYFICVFL